MFVFLFFEFVNEHDFNASLCSNLKVYYFAPSAGGETENCSRCGGGDDVGRE